MLVRMKQATPSSARKTLRPLKGVRVLSLALNLPGPAALMRLAQLGATCVKIEPPSGDPMQHYSQSAYAQLHQGVKVRSADAKSDKGMAIIHAELAKADVLITSFRPSALVKLGLGWKALHKLYPALCQVSIVGACGERAEEPGHDLTYQAEHGLVNGQSLPATLYADMGGSLAATEAVLAALRQRDQHKTGKGIHLEVGLAESAGYLALPRAWGMTTPKGMVGGLHAGYQVFACKDGRVALAALEPHFAKRLCDAASVADSSLKSMISAKTTGAVAKFLASQTRKALDKLAVEKDIPLHTLPQA
jgi:crotonobetainyl-CoA:carnitine CoA-transferase CaiB-like acyl-CoA transferase